MKTTAPWPMEDAPLKFVLPLAVAADALKRGIYGRFGADFYCTVISAAVRGIIMIESDSVIAATVK